MAVPVGDFILAEGETYQQCPYNLSHSITNARLIVHMDKCRRAYLKAMSAAGKKPDMKQCRFNYIHHVPAPEIDFHESRCQDQFNVVASLQYHESDEFTKTLQDEQRRKEEAEKEYQNSQSSHHDKKHSKKHKSKDVKPQLVKESPWGEDAEDWEAESNGYETGYDPSQKLASEIVLFHPRGLSKSERKTFRSEQRARAAEMSRPPTAENVDVKPIVEKMDIKVSPQETKFAPSTSKAPPPVCHSVKIDQTDFIKEDGECSDDDFYGEDPYST